MPNKICGPSFFSFSLSLFVSFVYKETSEVFFKTSSRVEDCSILYFQEQKKNKKSKMNLILCSASSPLRISFIVLVFSLFLSLYLVLKFLILDVLYIMSLAMSSKRSTYLTLFLSVFTVWIGVIFRKIIN